MDRILMEVCCYNLESALAAEKLGADRIELCDNAFEGGTTPSLGSIKIALQQLSIPVFVMIRPRGGDFLFSPEEIEAMLEDVKSAKQTGVHGLVVGALDPHGRLDLEVLRRLIDAASPLPVTLHQAFDLTVDPLEALHQAQDLGIKRILSSGQAATAEKGLPLLKQLTSNKSEQIEVIPGAGINAQNLLSILAATGAREFHISAGGTRGSKMLHKPVGIPMGHASAAAYQIQTADSHKLQEIRYLADKISEND